MNVQETNVALARAFGLRTDQLRRFELHVEAGTLPIIKAEYFVRSAAGLGKVTEEFELKPKAEPVDATAMCDTVRRLEMPAGT